MPPNDFSFRNQLAYSRKLSTANKAIEILMTNIPGARSVTSACKENDKAGVDFWVEVISGRHLGVDVKSRKEDYLRKEGKDDLVLETFSVVEKDKIGWTRDDSKRCDYVLWIWEDTGRWCLIPFHQLCAVMQQNWQKWRLKYGYKRQRTVYLNRRNNYQSETIDVPRREALTAIYRRYSGNPRPVESANGSHNFHSESVQQVSLFDDLDNGKPSERSGSSQTREEGKTQ